MFSSWDEWRAKYAYAVRQIFKDQSASIFAAFTTSPQRAYSALL